MHGARLLHATQRCVAQEITLAGELEPPEAHRLHQWSAASPVVGGGVVPTVAPAHRQAPVASAFALAAAFIDFLYARTCPRAWGPSMSATERKEPGTP